MTSRLFQYYVKRGKAKRASRKGGSRFWNRWNAAMDDAFREAWHRAARNTALTIQKAYLSASFGRHTDEK